MDKRKVIVIELIIQTKSNDYKRETHREKDMMRKREKYVKKTKNYQDTTLKRYVYTKRLFYLIEKTLNIDVIF